MKVTCEICDDIILLHEEIDDIVVDNAGIYHTSCKKEETTSRDE